MRIFISFVGDGTLQPGLGVGGRPSKCLLGAEHRQEAPAADPAAPGVIADQCLHSGIPQRAGVGRRLEGPPGEAPASDWTVRLPQRSQRLGARLPR